MLYLVLLTILLILVLLIIQKFYYSRVCGASACEARRVKLVNCLRQFARLLGGCGGAAYIM